MRRMLNGFATAALLAGLVGCGAEEGEVKAPAPAEMPGPEVTVFNFLEAVRTGDDATAADMLTPLARQKTEELDMVVAPPGSDTASFEVGEVELVAKDGAHVSSSWTDLDELGEPRTDSIVWMVRREFDGWRIAGMATKLFEDELPLFLNFEDPEDMLRKQQLLEEELVRRAQEELTGAPATAAQPLPEARR